MIIFLRLVLNLMFVKFDHIFRLSLESEISKDGTTWHKETHGCIRMGKEDLKELFRMVKRGTEVYVY